MSKEEARQKTAEIARKRNAGILSKEQAAKQTEDILTALLEGTNT